LKFLASGVKPRKNKEAMADVLAELKADGLFYGDKVTVAKIVDSGDEDNGGEVVEKKRDKKSKDKKDKKVKKAKEDETLEEDSEVEKAKKSSKKRVKA